MYLPVLARLGPRLLFALGVGCGAAADPSPGVTSPPSTGSVATESAATDTPAPVSCGAQTTTVLPGADTVPARYKTSVAQQLEVVEGRYTGRMGWNANANGVTVVHAGTSTELTVEVAYTGGEIRLTEVERVGESSTEEPRGVPCTNVLEVDMSVSFTSDDGLFAERWTLPMKSFSEGGLGYPQSSSFSIDSPIDFDVHQGTLRASDFQFEGGTVAGVQLTAEFPIRGPAVGGLALRVDPPTAAELGDVAWVSAATER